MCPGDGSRRPSSAGQGYGPGRRPARPARVQADTEKVSDLEHRPRTRARERGVDKLRAERVFDARVPSGGGPSDAGGGPARVPPAGGVAATAAASTADGPRLGYPARRMTRPDFFLVGAFKSGSTALYEQLRRHPQIFMPFHKEPLYFGDDLTRRYGRMSEDDYLRLFRDAKPNQRVGEASTWYLYSESAAREIREFSPDAQILVCLLYTSPSPRD